jgi:hypothetical protein
MDPRAALNQAALSLAAREFSTAASALFDYYRWRLRGGFEPPGGDACAERLSHRLLDSMEMVV